MSAKISSPTSDPVKTSELQGNVSELKRLLSNSAGEHLAVTITKGDDERKFDVVLPKDFVR